MGFRARISSCMLLVIVLACSAPARVCAQDERIDPNQDVEPLFLRALERYQRGHYTRTRLEFQDLLTRFPGNQRSSAARLMLAKALYKLEEYDRAIQMGDALIADHPSSPLAAYAQFVIGDCRYRQGRYGDAGAQYAKVIQNAPPALRERALVRVGMLASSQLTQREIEMLKATFGSRWVDEAVGLGEALWVFKWGYVDLARDKARALLGRFPQSMFREEARALLGEAETGPPAGPAPEVLASIGVICPLSGAYRAFGEDLRDGIQLGLEHFARPSDHIGLIFEDSKSDPILAVQITQKLVEQDGVLGLIGPVRSASTIGVAAVANAASIPLIAPTASEDPVAAIGPGIFQLNTTPTVEGHRLAEYAVGTLGLRTFAILASSDAYGQKLSDAFAERAQELDAEIIAREAYFKGTTDFGTQLRRIREAGLAYSPPDTGAVEEEMAEMPPDTTDLELLTSIEGVVLAGHPEEVVLIAPQQALYRIEAQLLGGGGWNAPEVPRQGGQYVEGATFVSGYFEDRSSSSFRRFLDGFTGRFGRAPGIPAAFGYDASAMMIRALQGGHTDREGLRNALAGIQRFSGATGPVSFSANNRTNSEVFVLKIVRGRIVPVEMR